jgi:hypothetical protein
MPADVIMDTGYKNTISGLLRRRGEMLANKADLRERRSQCCQPLAGPPRFGLSMAGSQRRGEERPPSGALGGPAAISFGCG